MNRWMNRWTRRVAIFSFALVLMLAGCSSRPTPTNQPAPAGGAQPAAAGGATNAPSSAKPIKVGVIYLLTGQYNSYGLDNMDGTKIALEQLKAKGLSRDGRPIDLVVQDSASDPAQAAALVRKLAADPDVVAIIGPVASTELVAAAPVADQEKIMILSTGSANPWKGAFNPWTFRLNLVSIQAVPPVLETMVQKKGWKRIAILYDVENEFTVGESQVVADTVKKLGATVVGTESFRVKDSDFSAQISKIAPLKPDAIWLSGTANEAAPIIRQARQAGIEAPFIGGAGLNDVSIYKLSGGLAGGGVYTFFGFDSSDPRPMVQGLVTDYQKLDGKQGKKPVPYTGLGYDAVVLMTQAIKNAKTVDRQGVRDAFASLSGVEGVNGSYTYKGSGDNQTPNFHIMLLNKDGAFERAKL